MADGPWSLDLRPLIALDPTVPETIREAALRDAAASVVSTIKASWPVDTGLSIAGFSIDSADNGHVYNDVDYTEFVHDGLVDRLAASALSRARAVALQSVARIMLQERASGRGKPLARTPFSAQAKRPARPGTSSARVASILTEQGTPPQVVSLYRAGRITEALTLLRVLTQGTK